jgi:hypothetical protein
VKEPVDEFRFALSAIDVSVIIIKLLVLWPRVIIAGRSTAPRYAYPKTERTTCVVAGSPVGNVP